MAHYRQAFVWFVDRGDAEQAARLVAGLRDYWWAHELFAEGQEWIARLLRLPKLPIPIHAAVLDQAGALAFAQAEFSRARRYFAATVRLRRMSGSHYLLALVLNHLAAATRWDTSDDYDALPLYEESVVLAEEAHDRLLIAAALMPLGSLAIERGDLADAERLLRQGLAIYIELELTTAYPLALEQFAALAAVGG
jgi:hypothetical protein